MHVKKLFEERSEQRTGYLPWWVALLLFLTVRAAGSLDPVHRPSVSPQTAKISPNNQNEASNRHIHMPFRPSLFFQRTQKSFYRQPENPSASPPWQMDQQGGAPKQSTEQLPRPTEQQKQRTNGIQYTKTRHYTDPHRIISASNSQRDVAGAETGAPHAAWRLIPPNALVRSLSQTDSAHYASL